MSCFYLIHWSFTCNQSRFESMRANPEVCTSQRSPIIHPTLTFFPHLLRYSLHLGVGKWNPIRAEHTIAFSELQKEVCLIKVESIPVLWVETYTFRRQFDSMTNYQSNNSRFYSRSYDLPPLGFWSGLQELAWNSLPQRGSKSKQNVVSYLVTTLPLLYQGACLAW